MKLIYFTSIILFSTILNAQVKILLKNNTGERIDSLTVENIFLGTIEKDSTKTVSFQSISCDSGNPIIALSGNIGLKKYKKENFLFCGTFLKTVTEAEYKRNIILLPINGNNILIASEK
ncbi:hypothetical protein [Flavobacterium restrictum]|uniref:Uncharacterized protein n=1 Tax=Flavobacterium restrictum TaxID=2594428 RepID=A0A553E1U7_9FLAO|nr:hypothetical protein [Flavobacterium restrictum]TRX39028.1 hypothetical protein FNW21_10580 [Flavobacterium restrictum]